MVHTPPVSKGPGVFNFQVLKFMISQNVWYYQEPRLWLIVIRHSTLVLDC